MTTISVIIPAKNDVSMLERCLRAMAAQERRADEIIVVDNGSTDATAAVAQALGAVVISEERPGITAAASRGYDSASGDLIARCDADSVVAPSWLAAVERAFERRPDAVAITAGASFYDLSRFAGWWARVLYLDAYFIAVGAAVANVPVFGSNFAMRSSLWRHLSSSVPRDVADLHDDFDLSYRISPGDRVVFERALEVAISGRPFRDARAFRRRLRMAGVTFRQHLPAQLPHRRWRRRLHARRDQGLASNGHS